MLSAAVQEVLKVAVQEVQRRRHELLTVEHILFSLTTVAPGRLLLEGSGASVAVLREQLEGFFRNEMQVLPDQGEHEVHQTAHRKKPRPSCWPSISKASASAASTRMR